jgi:site-specific DNA-methyltransferase (adenine-specific)
MKLWYKDDFCTLIQGDCLQVMAKMAEKDLRFDAIITDPPYGTTACKWDSIIPLDEMWKLLIQLRKENAPIVLFGSEPFSSILRISNIKEFKYDWIWKKNTGTGICSAKYQPMKYHENISVFGKGKTIYNPQPTKRTVGSEKRCKSVVIGGSPNSEHIPLKNMTIKYDPNNKNPESVLIINTEPNSLGKLHPTQKPLELMEYLIKTYTNEGDTILDFTCGSGTTLVAAKKLKRKCYGIELEEKYCEVTKNRLLELQ